MIKIELNTQDMFNAGAETNPVKYIESLGSVIWSYDFELMNNVAYMEVDSLPETFPDFIKVKGFNQHLTPQMNLIDIDAIKRLNIELTKENTRLIEYIQSIEHVKPSEL